jgi:CBS domain-containing protein
MFRFQQTFAIVVEEDVEKLAGIVTHADVFRKILPSQEELMEKQDLRVRSEVIEDRYLDVYRIPVEEVMTRNPITIEPGVSLVRAGGLMNARRVKQLPVVERGILQGVIHYTDINLALMLRHSRWAWTTD